MLLLDATFVLEGKTMDKKYIRGKATVWPDDEEQEILTAYFVPPKKTRYSAKWALLWTDETGAGIVEQAQMEKPLTQIEYRVRDYILGTIGIGNYVYVNQAEVGRQLRIDRAHISRAIKRLIELQILVAGPKSGRSNTYMVNPAFCFAGGLRNGIQARREAKQSGKILPFRPLPDERED